MSCWSGLERPRTWGILVVGFVIGLLAGGAWDSPPPVTIDEQLRSSRPLDELLIAAELRSGDLAYTRQAAQPLRSRPVEKAAPERQRGPSRSPVPIPAVVAAARKLVNGIAVADLAGAPLDLKNPRLEHPYSRCYGQSPRGLGFKDQPLLKLPGGPGVGAGSCSLPLHLHQYRMAGGVAYSHLMFMSQASAMVSQRAGATLTLWTEDPDELRSSPYMAWLLRHFGPAANGTSVVDPLTGQRLAPVLDVRRLDVNELAVGTPVHGTGHLSSRDSRGWLNSDLARLLIMNAVGGVYVDSDMLFMRSLEPFACLAADTGFYGGWMCWGPEMQVDGYKEIDNGPADLYMNNAFSGFSAGHPNVKALLQEIGRTPHGSSEPSTHYNCGVGNTVYWPLFNAHRRDPTMPKPFTVLPWCYSEAGMCPLPEDLPEVMATANDSTWAANAHRIAGIWMFHTHNRYNNVVEPKSPIDRLHAAIYAGLIKRYGAAIGHDMPDDAKEKFSLAAGAAGVL